MKLVPWLLAFAGASALAAHPTFAPLSTIGPKPQTEATFGVSAVGRDKLIIESAQQGGRADDTTPDGMPLPAEGAKVGYTSLDFKAKCDGLTDDTVPEQKTIAAAANARVLANLAPAGKTCVASGLVLSGAFNHLRVDGILKGVRGNNSSMILNHWAQVLKGTAETNITIDGIGTIDNAHTSAGHPNPTSCISLFGPVADIKISGLRLLNCGNDPINIVGHTEIPGAGARNVLLSHLTADGENHDPIQFAQGCDNCWADHLKIKNLLTDYGFAFYGNVTNSGLTNSLIDNTAGAVTVLADGACDHAFNSYPSVNILIQGNVLTRSAGPAILVGNSATGCAHPKSKHRKLRIINNIGYDNNTHGNGNWGGEAIYNASEVESRGNRWHGDGPPAGTPNPKPSAGFYIGGTVDHFSSAGDHVWNEAPNAGMGIGAVIGAGATDISFAGTEMYDSQAKKTMAYAFNGQCTLRCVFVGNILGPMIGQPFSSLKKGSDTVVR